MRCPDDYNLIFMPFPGDIYACVRVDHDGYPTIYVNVHLSPEARKRALDHELRHFVNGDLYSHVSIHDIETDTLTSRPLSILSRSYRELSNNDQASLVTSSVSLIDHIDRQVAGMSVPERLRTLRRLKRISLADLSRVTRISPERLEAYETGVQAPDDASRLQLAYYYSDDGLLPGRR